MRRRRRRPKIGRVIDNTSPVCPAPPPAVVVGVVVVVVVVVLVVVVVVFIYTGFKFR